VIRLHPSFIDDDRPDFGTVTLNADGTMDPAELERFDFEPLPDGDEDGQDPAFFGTHCCYSVPQKFQFFRRCASLLPHTQNKIKQSSPSLSYEDPDLDNFYFDESDRGDEDDV
jgi:hypothetical protein